MKTLILFCLIALVACTPQSDPEPLVSSGSVIGSWTIVKSVWEKCDDPDNNFVEVSDCSVKCRRYAFSDNGTFIYHDVEDGIIIDTIPGIYSISDGKIFVSTWAVYELSFEKSDMIWVGEKDGCNFTVTLSK